MTTKKLTTAKSNGQKVPKNVEPIPAEITNFSTVEEIFDENLIHVINPEAAEVIEPETLHVVLTDEAFTLGFPQVDDPQKILDSKKYVKGAVSYNSPREILAPCILAMNNANGKITLTGTNESTNANADLTKNISYGRLNLVSRWEIDEDTFYEVGILAAYDLQSPKLKIYRGAKVRACTNLCIYQADDIVKFDISEGINQQQVNAFLQNLTEKIQESIEIANRLKAILIPEKMMSEIIGKMMMETVEKETSNGTNSILMATKLFTDSKSKYYFRQPNFNGWQLFNGFTEHFSSKVNFFDIPEKTRDTYQLLKDICLS